jgi:hypothetical protein
LLSETEVYVNLKAYLQEKDWEILGGQPPGGTNSIPLIEIKDRDYRGKGSKGSKKIDLVGFREPFFLLVELKESLSESDISKLRDVTGDSVWREAFLVALEEKGRYPKGLQRYLYTRSDSFLVKALGFNAGEGLGPRDFVTFLVGADTVDVHLGAETPSELKSLL